MKVLRFLSAAAAVWVAGASLAQPANDNCADAIDLTGVAPGVDGRIRATGDSTLATTDGAATSPCDSNGPGVKDVWYTFTPSVGGQWLISLCESHAQYAVSFMVLEGGCGGQIVDCSVNSGCYPATEGAVELAAGVNYLIRVAGASFPWGDELDGAPYTLSLLPPPEGACCLGEDNCALMTRADCAAAGGSYFGDDSVCGSIVCGTAPVNDDCVDALPLGENAVATGNNTFASSENTAACFEGGSEFSGNDVWYVVNPTQKGVLQVSTCNSTFDTTLRVFEGTCGSLAPIVTGCNNNDFSGVCAQPQSAVRVEVFPGQSYYIRLAGRASYDEGSLAASGDYEVVTQLYPAPVNDDCAGAINLTGMSLPIFLFDNNDGATSELDPNLVRCDPGNPSSRDIWYSYTPAVSGRLHLSTCGSATSTQVHIFTGACGSLTEVTCDAQNYQWCVDFTGNPDTEGRGAPDWAAVAGTTYYIRISTDGSLADPRTGDIAIMLDGYRDPHGACCMGDASPCQLLSETDCLAMGGTYLGDHTLCNTNTWFCPQPNDDCENAAEMTVVVGGSDLLEGQPFFGYIPLGNTADGHAACDVANDTGSNDSWFRFTVPSTGAYSISACGSDWESLSLSVYESCADKIDGELVCVTSDTAAVCSFDPSAPSTVLILEGGREYLLRLAGHQNQDLFGTFIADIDIEPWTEPTGPCCLPDMSTVTMTDADCIGAGGVWAGHMASFVNCPTLPANNSCRSAMVLTPGAPAAPLVIDANSTPTAFGSCRSDFNLPLGDLWFSFEALTNHSYSIVTGDFSANLAIFDGCDSPRIEYACGARSVDFTAPADGTYYIWAGADFDVNTTIEVQLTNVPTGACCMGTGCDELTKADCDLAGGVYSGDFTRCSDTPYRAVNVNADIINGFFGCAGATEDTITIADGVTITSLAVEVDLVYGAGGDLDLELVGPGGLVVPLALRSGTTGDTCDCGTALGAFGFNLDGVYVFDDAASVSWHEASAEGPLASGRYRPAGCGNAASSLSAFAGLSASGDWTLRVADEVPGFSPGNAGRLRSWALYVNGGFSTCVSACPCEFDGAEGVDVFDLLAYLDLWFAGDAAADLDGTEGVDVFDLLSFLDCWFPASAGGC